MGNIILKYGTPVQQIDLVHIITNSIHYHYINDVHGLSKLNKLWCNHCDEMLSIDHVVICNSSYMIRLRNTFHSAIISLLKSTSCCDEWIRKSSTLSLMDLLDELFPTLVEASYSASNSIIFDELHFRTSVMIGAFNERQQNKAIKLLKVKEKVDGINIFNQLRILCVEFISNTFQSWKMQFLP